MKKIINKIIAILDYDVYRFTLAPFVIFFFIHENKNSYNNMDVKF